MKQDTSVSELMLLMFSRHMPSQESAQPQSCVNHREKSLLIEETRQGEGTLCRILELALMSAIVNHQWHISLFLLTCTHRAHPWSQLPFVLKLYCLNGLIFFAACTLVRYVRSSVNCKK
jgi:hypothetical protein